MRIRFNKRYAIAFIIAIGTLLRILLIFLFPGLGNSEIMDSHAYNEIAISVANGEGFSLYNIPTAFVAPLYPLLLSVIYDLAGYSYLIAKVFNVLIASITLLIIYYIGKELFNYWIGLIASLICSFHPELVGLTSFIYTETLNTLFVGLFVFTFIKGIKEKKREKPYFALSGLLLGLSTLTKGTTLMFPLFIMIFLFFDRDLRQRIVPLIIFLFVFCLTLVPWTIRNYMRFHIILPVATGGGQALWTGNYIPFDGEYRYEQTKGRIEELTKDRPWIQHDSILMAEAKKMILDNPFTCSKLFFKKIYRFWIKVYENIPRGLQRNTNIFFHWGLTIIHLLLLFLAIIGIYKSKIEHTKIRILYYLLVYYTLIHAITFAVPRYRIPVMPFIVIFSSIGIFHLFSKHYSMNFQTVKLK